MKDAFGNKIEIGSLVHYKGSRDLGMARGVVVRTGKGANPKAIIQNTSHWQISPDKVSSKFLAVVGSAKGSAISAGPEMQIEGVAYAISTQAEEWLLEQSIKRKLDHLDSIISDYHFQTPSYLDGIKNIKSELLNSISFLIK